MDFNARIRELQAAILVKKARRKGHALLDWRLERARTKQLQAERREERKRAKAQKDLVSLARHCDSESDRGYARPLGIPPSPGRSPLMEDGNEPS